MEAAGLISSPVAFSNVSDVLIYLKNGTSKQARTRHLAFAGLSKGDSPDLWPNGVQEPEQQILTVDNIN